MKGKPSVSNGPVLKERSVMKNISSPYSAGMVFCHIII